MVAPVVVSHDVTAGGVLFAAVMIAAALPLFLRLRWRTLVAALWAIGFAETLVLLAVSHAHHGFTSAVIATAVVAALFIAVTFALELTRSTRTSVGWLASIIAGSAFTLSLGAAFLYAGERQVNGHSLAGLALIVVALAWAVLAAVPTLARRPHVNLTDGLVAFALAALAIATGLLAGGPALVCAWAAESAMLIALAERAARRDVRRRPRLVISAGIYLVLATAATWLIVAPSDGHLTAIGAGSASGVIALVAIAIAGVVFSFGTRWLSFGEQQITWALPAIALGFLPVWALPAEWAVVAYAGMAAAMLVYRRSPAMIGWMRDEVTIVVAGGWWLSGALVAVAVTAPIRELGQGWKMLGAGDGVTGLVALLAAAAVFVWSVRRPQRRFWEFALLAPVVTFAYLVAEVLAAPYAMWAWLVAASGAGGGCAGARGSAAAWAGATDRRQRWVADARRHLGVGIRPLTDGDHPPRALDGLAEHRACGRRVADAGARPTRAAATHRRSVGTVAARRTARRDDAARAVSAGHGRRALGDCKRDRDHLAQPLCGAL